MDSRQAIKMCIDTAAMVCNTYLDDLSDDDMMKRPHPECNHIKWQVGHLISSDNMMVEGVMHGAMPALPEGFAERYSKDTAKVDDASKFDSKEELMKLAEQQRTAALGILEKVSDDELQKAAPESMQAYAPNVAAVFSMLGSHWMMHAGQWVVVRRAAGRDIKI